MSLKNFNLGRFDSFWQSWSWFWRRVAMRDAHSVVVIQLILACCHRFYWFEQPQSHGLKVLSNCGEVEFIVRAG